MDQRATTDEIRAAFAHPEVRAAMTAARPLDRISLRDHLREVEIGAFQVERGVTQRLSFDLVVEVKDQGSVGDDVDRILSYDRLSEAIDTELGHERLALLETLAERIAARILREPQAERVFLRIQKLDRGPGALGVEIVRGRDDLSGPSEEDEVGKKLRPRVVLLGKREAASPDLGKALHRLREDATPLLLVAPAPKAPKAATPEAQERVDLLAADQGAWILAASHEEIVVAATRTEVDWNLRRGRTVAWAPAKLALDEPSLRGGALERTIFFACSLDALEVVVIGPSLDGLVEAPLRVRRATLEAPLE